MGVAFVRATEGTSVIATLTLNIQSSGVERVLVVGVAYKSGSVVPPTSVIWDPGGDNQAFTLERAAADGGDAQCFLYRLVAPTVKTANVVITMPEEMRMVGYVALFTGVNQSTPFTAATNEAQGTDAAPTVTINSASDEICLDILAQVSAGPHTATPSWTPLCNSAAVGGGSDCRGAGQYVAGVASRVMDYAMSGSDNWNIIAAALQGPPSAEVPRHGFVNFQTPGVV